MKSVFPIILAVFAAGMLLAGCAGANPNTAAILATNEAAAATSVAQIATSTEAANMAATGVVLTQNAPPTPTPTPPTPIKPLVVAEYEPAADARTAEQICVDALPAEDPASRTFTQAEQVLQADVDYRAIFCTSAGPVYIDLLEEQTPVTVNNLVFLSEKGYFNNTTFHRVIDEFMAQGGDPTATGTGDPGYSFQDEFVSDLRFDGPGKLAMANSGPATNGSQFFITTVPTAQLNDRHTIFGQVIQGQGNVAKIELRDPETATTPGTSLDTIIIITDPTTVLLADRVTATQDEVVEAMDGVDAIITEDLAAVLENTKVVQTTDEAVDAAPEAIRESLSGLLGDNNHQYRVGSTLNNKACDVSQVQFIGASYTVDAFASSADALKVVSDPAWAQISLDSGFTEQSPSGNLPYPVFSQQITMCDQLAVRALTYWQRGPFVVTVEITLPDSSNDIPATATATLDEVVRSMNLDRILVEFVGGRIYEPLLSTVLYKDIQ